MDFNHSERSTALQDQVRAFLDEHVYPAEHDYHQQAAANTAAAQGDHQQRPQPEHGVAP